MGAKLVSVVAEILVVDVGNTSVKYTAFQGEGVIWQVRDDELLSKLPFSPKAIYFASVRSKQESEALQESLKHRFPQAQWAVLQSEAVACGVYNAYPEPHRLGIDRWLTVVAAYHHFATDVVIVDAGTAIKVDLVSSKAQHLGGYITPGLAMMEASLLANTAKIRYDNSEKVTGKGLPNSTARAVGEGCYEMALGFLQRIHTQYAHFTWVVTGGDGKALLDRLGIAAHYEPNLIALGARLVGNEMVRSDS